MFILLHQGGMEEVVLCIRRLQVRFRQVWLAIDQWVQVQLVVVQTALGTSFGSESCHRRTLVSISLPVVCEHARPGSYHFVMISSHMC